MTNETHKKSLRKFQRDGHTSVCCSLCAENDPRTIEMHHYEGRMFPDQVIPVCKNCHAKITAEQNKIPPKARSKNASPEQKEGHRFVITGALLEVLGGNMKEYGFIKCDHK